MKEFYSGFYVWKNINLFIITMGLLPFPLVYLFWLINWGVEIPPLIKKCMKCIIRLGTFVEGLINVITFGHGSQFAGWVSWTFFKNPDCGCERRKQYLDNLFGCSDGIKLN